MVTKVISLKDYRQNITYLWKESRKNNIRYIVLYHARPILDVRPFQSKELIFDDQSEKEDRKAYYQTLEQTLNFWKDEQDDNIFLY